MKVPVLSLLLIGVAVALRTAYQAPFEVLDTTVWQPLLPPLPAQFLTAYLLPQICLYLAAYCWREGYVRALDGLLRWLEPRWVCPLVTLVAAVLFRHLGLFDALVVSDEFSFNFHAICLSMGRPGCLPPPYPDHFQFATLYIGPHIWTGISSPGWPAMLALGYLLGCPRLVDPLLAALITYQLQTLARGWYGARASSLTGLLLLGSPMFLLNACADYSHLATVFWSLNALICLEKVNHEGNGRGWSLLGGACLGMVVATRPLDGVLVLAALLLWRVVLGKGPGRPSFLQVALVGLGMIPGSFLNFWQNVAVSGSPWVTAYALLDEVSGQFDLSPLVRIALCGYIYARAAVWMFPGFLESIPLMRTGQGRVGLIFLGLYIVGYARPGFFEIGSRYALNACLLLLPLMAGAICQSKVRQSCVLPCLLLALLGAYPGEARSLMRSYRYQWTRDNWLARSLPPRSIVFFRRMPPGVLGIARNYPDLREFIQVLALDPQENLKLREHFQDRAAFYVDWVPEGGTYQITPFAEPHDLNMDRICAGMNYANLKFTQEKALLQWSQIPTDSPFYEAARQNRIKLLNKLGRHEEAKNLSGPRESGQAP